MNKPLFLSSAYLLFFLGILGYFAFDAQTDIGYLKDLSFGQLHLLQALNAILVFLLPALVYKGLFRSQHPNFLKWQNPQIAYQDLILVVLIFICAFPAIGSLAAWNNEMHFPEAFQSVEHTMRNSQKLMEEITLVLLEMHSVGDLFLAVFVVGLVAAFTEEVLFRGVLQQHLQILLKNKHIAIWVTAALFSLLHGQIFGFVPRMLLGALLGYLYAYSANLWIPILGHFVNNATQVVLLYVFMQDHPLEELVDEAPTGISWAIASGLITLVLMYYFIQNQRNKPLEDAGTGF